MNVLMLLTNKDAVSYLYETNTIRQGLEKMRAHGYTAIPVLSESGKYVGSVSEGDFLRHLLDHRDFNLKSEEHCILKDIIREDFNPPVKIDVSMHDLLERSMTQNFIPVTDDRGYFIGIVTRQDIIRQFLAQSDRN